MYRKQLSIIFAILVVALLVAAYTVFAGNRTAQIPEITIRAADYSFTAPDQIEAGLVMVNLVNDGREPHHAQMARLNDGVSMSEFQAALSEGPAAFEPLITFVGGPGLVDPGLQTGVTLDLDPGQYILLCFVPGHDGVPHLAKGMVRPLEVVAGSGKAETAELSADAVVTLRDFAIVLPDEINAGRQVWEVVNEGPQPHEVVFIKLAEGKSMADVAAFMESPGGQPPFVNMGGFQAIHPGETGWLTLDLEPGEYVALCHVPDPATGHAHLELGMLAPFTVR